MDKIGRTSIMAVVLGLYHMISSKMKEQLQVQIILNECTLCYYFRRDYIFWIDENGNNRLLRSRLNGTNVTLLVNSGIGCSGNFMCLEKKGCDPL